MSYRFGSGVGRKGTGYFTGGSLEEERVDSSHRVTTYMATEARKRVLVLGVKIIYEKIGNFKFRNRKKDLKNRRWNNLLRNEV